MFAVERRSDPFIQTSTLKHGTVSAAVCCGVSCVPLCLCPEAASSLVHPEAAAAFCSPRCNHTHNYSMYSEDTEMKHASYVRTALPACAAAGDGVRIVPPVFLSVQPTLSRQFTYTKHELL